MWFRCSLCLVSSIYSTIAKPPFSVWSRDEQIRASPPWHHTEAQVFHLLMQCFQSLFRQVVSSMLTTLNMEALLQLLLECAHLTLFLSCHLKTQKQRQWTRVGFRTYPRKRESFTAEWHRVFIRRWPFCNIMKPLYPLGRYPVKSVHCRISLCSLLYSLINNMLSFERSYSFKRYFWR